MNDEKAIPVEEKNDVPAFVMIPNHMTGEFSVNHRAGASAEESEAHFRAVLEDLKGKPYRAIIRRNVTVYEIGPDSAAIRAQHVRERAH